MTMLIAFIVIKKKLVNQNLIHSKNHNVNSITQTKFALSPHDKPFIILGSHETLPWGHTNIKDTE